MVDRYIRGQVDRISPEAPVPVVDVKHLESMPGGAGNVAVNIAAAGGEPILVSVVGPDRDGEMLLDDLRNRGVTVSGVIADGARPTIVKTRVIAGHQQVVRFDLEKRHPLSHELTSHILRNVRELVPKVKGIILSDYGKGIVSASLLKALLPLARKHKKFILVDPKVEHFLSYKGIDCMTPNLKEAAEGLRALPARTDEEVDRLGRDILKKLKSRAVLITRGERGMSLYEASGRATHIPSQAQEVFDVTGAGDTVISILGLSLAAGCSLVEAALIANATAGVVVGKLGTAAASQAEIKKALAQVDMKKVVTARA
jgi:rfaE bifunctional protein kinase chain/domain